jgi:hypothetical protein
MPNGRTGANMPAYAEREVVVVQHTDAPAIEYNDILDGDKKGKAKRLSIYTSPECRIEDFLPQGRKYRPSGNSGSLSRPRCNGAPRELKNAPLWEVCPDD